MMVETKDMSCSSLGYREQIERIKEFSSGEKEIYDSSLFELLHIRERVANARVLDIGAMALRSSADIARAGAQYVCVIEPHPFGVESQITSGLSELIKWHSQIRGYDPQRVRIVQDYAGRGLDIRRLGVFDAAYFFFPPIPMIGNHIEYSLVHNEEEFRRLVESVCGALDSKGTFTIVSEVPPDCLRTVNVEGFERKIQRLPGKPLYSEIERLAGWFLSSHPLIVTPIRPASSLALSVLEYSRT